MNQRNEKLTTARLEKNLTQTEACEKIGVPDVRTWQRWENEGVIPNPYYRRKLCNYFNTSFEDLGLQAKSTHSEASTEEDTEASHHVVTLTHEQVAFLSSFLLEENTMNFDASRRAILLQMLGLTTTALTIPIHDMLNPEPWERLTQAVDHPSNIDERALAHFSELTDTGWKLSNASESATVEQMLPTYLPKVATLARQDSVYQKDAAAIASKGYILASEVDHGNIRAMERYCELAVDYSQIAEDHNIHIAALKQQATIALVAKKPDQALKIYQRTLPFIHFVSPLLRARIYMGLASAYARCNQPQQAQRYIGLAHEAFPVAPEDDPSYLYTVCNLPVLYLYDALAYMDMNRPQQAWKALVLQL